MNKSKKADNQLSSYLELTILMPCLNEEETIADCIIKAKDFLKRNQINGEVLVADNGSTDCSVWIASHMGARVIHVKKKGYGNALRGGIEAAFGRYCIMGDCDGSYDFLNLETYLKYLRMGNDLVMGNRLNNNMEKGAMPFTHKYIGVPFLSWLGRKIYHSDIKDFHCGLRGFNTEKIKKLNLSSHGMEFASEMIGEATKANYQIIETPITFKRDKRNNPSHMRPIRDGLRHVWMIGKGRQK